MVQTPIAAQADLTAFGRDLGTGTALPTTGPSATALRRGDVYQHTGVGCLMVWNGGNWRQVTTSGGDPAFLVANYSAVLHAGFRTFFGGVPWTWDGAVWAAAAALLGAQAMNTNGNIALGASSSWSFAALPASARVGSRVACRIAVGWWNNSGAQQQFSVSAVTATNGTISQLETGSAIVPVGLTGFIYRAFLLDVTATAPVIGFTVTMSGSGAATMNFGPFRLEYTVGVAA